MQVTSPTPAQAALYRYKETIAQPEREGHFLEQGGLWDQTARALDKALLFPSCLDTTLFYASVSSLVQWQ